MAAAEDVWQLKIPVRLSLARSEISSPGDVKPVYLLAPRHAYLPALAQQSLAFFQHVLLRAPGPGAPGGPWFEQQGAPLNWTQPLGVLHDLLAPCPPPEPAPGGAAPPPPWCLTVHYRGMPAALANPWQNAGGAKEHYLSSIKEAGYCCRGSDGAGAVMRLPGAAQDELWGALNRGDGAGVRQVLAQLRLVPSVRPGSAVPCVPVRVFVRQHAPPGQEDGSAWQATYSSSRPVEVTQPDGSATLLAHLLHTVMPRRFPAPVPAAGAAAGAAQPPEPHALQEQQQEQQEQQGPAAEAAGTPSSPPDDPLRAAVAAPGDEGGGAAAAEAPSPPPPPPPVPLAASHVLPAGWPRAAALVCGVQPDWLTPLAWLHAQLGAADGFLQRQHDSGRHRDDSRERSPRRRSPGGHHGHSRHDRRDRSRDRSRERSRERRRSRSADGRREPPRSGADGGRPGGDRGERPAPPAYPGPPPSGGADGERGGGGGFGREQQQQWRGGGRGDGRGGGRGRRGRDDDDGGGQRWGKPGGRRGRRGAGAARRPRARSHGRSQHANAANAAPRRPAEEWAAEEAARAAPPVPKAQPNMGLSGKLAAETNKTVDGTAELKYQPPPEARVCRKPAWRLYIFKGRDEAAPPIALTQTPFYLLGKDRKVADIPTDHPSCSRQHAVLCFREVEVDAPDGLATRRVVKPYVIDLETVNGTTLNGERLEGARYYELLHSDVLRFGFSSREYVIMNEDAL
ncbi:Snip1 [Scenedesmus sp. PABB004]|nr:Snip1 [Scenedesmus sp. PABB004]